MIRRPPRSTLFPYRRSSDLVDGAHGTCFAGEEQLFAVMGDSQIRVGPSRNVANNRASLESELLARVEVGNHDGRLELRDTRDGHGRLLLGVVVILVGLVVNLGEKLGGDTRAALQRSELGMIDRNLDRKSVV